MTDRELLELAAKAIGYRYTTNHADAGWLCSLDSEGLEGYVCFWKPLADDGDALRLAVTLGLDINQFPQRSMVDVWTGKATGEEGVCTRELYNGDPLAATRRAIVRAAAEIRKVMP